MNEQPTPHDHPNQFEEESQKAHQATQRLKNRIMIIFACMLAFAVVGLLALSWIDNYEEDKKNGEKETMAPPSTPAIFPADYDRDIMQYQEYLELNRNFYHYNNHTGERSLILEEDIDINAYGPAVRVLKNMIKAIIAGDHEAYNALFSENYYELHGNQPQDEFTMQQVYDITFTFCEESEKTSEEIGKYIQYEFWVEYKIHENNFTFRQDLGQDDSRRQYFILTDMSGEVMIDQVLGVEYQ